MTQDYDRSPVTEPSTPNWTSRFPSNAFDALSETSEAFGVRDYVVIADTGQRVSFEDAARHATELASLLQGIGVGRGDRVCVALANSVEWVVAAFAVFRTGAVLVPLSTRLVDREVRGCINTVRPRAIIVQDAVRSRRLMAEWPSLRDARSDTDQPVEILVHPQPAERWQPPEPLGGRIGLNDSTDPAASATEVPRSRPPTAHADEEADEVAAILFTSGTTSAPKGVQLTHRGLLRLAYEVGRRQEVTHEDRFFSVAPFFHCSGFMHALLTTLMAGATLFTVSRYSPEGSRRILRETQVTVAHGPLPPGASCDAPGTFSLDRAWCGGNSDSLKALERSLNARICSLWGMTETGGCFAITTADESEDHRHTSAGRPLPGLEFRIVDPSGTVLGDRDAVGELQVRGWNVTPGYYEDPEATAAAFAAGGWLRTGDLVRRLAQDRFQLVGRLKDIIRVGGENISMAEVDSVLTSFEGVADAAVVARPDARLGEVPVAAIVQEPTTQLDPRRLREHCSSLLADFKIPREFYVVDAIPRTEATSRVQRHHLAQAISKGTAQLCPQK